MFLIINFILLAQIVKNLPPMREGLGLIPELGRPPGEGNDYPLQYSGLEISMDCTLHGVTKSQTFPFLGIYPDKTIIQKDTGTTIFITAPFSIAKNGHNLIVH